MVEPAAEGLVKIRFELDPKDWNGLKSESLWALELHPAEYLIRNSPFYAYGISAEDTVHVNSSMEFSALPVSRSAGATRRIAFF